MKKIVCVSDTHRKEYALHLPKGDILIHTGDFDIRDEFDLNYILNWLSGLNFKHIVFIGGNHDLHFEQLFNAEIEPIMPKNIHYLLNSSIEIEGIKIWGLIPSDTDIVITHCNPFGINDVVRGISQGCPALRNKIKEIKPKFHISGHIHEGYGVYQDKNTTYVNASVLDEFYDMTNKPIVIDYGN